MIPISQLRETISKRSDAQLLDMVKNADQYTGEAIDIAKEVCALRGLSVQKPAQSKPKGATLDASGSFLGINHPWLRLFARATDIAIVGLVLIGVCTISAPWINATVFKYFGLLCFSLFLIPFEAACLFLFYTTPGKALFGIVIPEEEKPSFTNLISRGFDVWVRGFGCGAVIPTMIVLAYNYGRLSENQSLAWDVKWRVPFVVRKKTLLAKVLCSMFSAAVISALVLILNESFRKTSRETLTRISQSFSSEKTFGFLQWSEHGIEASLRINFDGSRASYIFRCTPKLPNSSSTPLLSPHFKIELLDGSGFQVTSFIVLFRDMLRDEDGFIARGVINVTPSEKAAVKDWTARINPFTDDDLSRIIGAFRK